MRQTLHVLCCPRPWPRCTGAPGPPASSRGRRRGGSRRLLGWPPTWLATMAHVALHRIAKSMDSSTIAAHRRSTRSQHSQRRQWSPIWSRDGDPIATGVFHRIAPISTPSQSLHTVTATVAWSQHTVPVTVARSQHTHRTVTSRGKQRTVTVHGHSTRAHSPNAASRASNPEATPRTARRPPRDRHCRPRCVRPRARRPAPAPAPALPVRPTAS